MANPSSYSVFKPKFKKTIADAIYQEVTSQTAIYYHWFGKENPWTDFLSPFIGSSSGDYPGQPSNNFRYDLHVRRDILTAKRVRPADVAYVVRRIDWVYGTIYDMYDDSYGSDPTDHASVVGVNGATTLEDADYYVLTSDYNVYKCIWNNDNGASTVIPSGTTPEIFETSDGYKWKFMYTIPISLRNRFLSETYMPVTTSLQAAFFSEGQIESIAIENGGQDYNPATTSATIFGDGYSEFEPVKIDAVNVTYGGEGYTFTPTITISDPFPNYIQWEANKNVSVGSYVRYENPADSYINFYYVLSGTKLGTSGPIHTSGVATNGPAQLRYAGTTAKAYATMAGDAVDSVTLVENPIGYQGAYGYGYQSQPTASAEEPFDAATWTASTTVDAGALLKYSGRYYQVDGAGSGTTGTAAPTHTTGSAVNGSVTLNYIGKIPELVPNVYQTAAAIDLIISPGKDSLYKINVITPGSKYVELPGITISAPPVGTTATAYSAIADGQVTAITVLDVGNGYLEAPTVTVDRPKWTFTPVSAVNLTTNEITYDGHLLETGDTLTYDNNGGTDIGGITSDIIDAVDMSDGITYTIVDAGTTNFTLYGATSNDVGTTFVASGTPAVGTGTVKTTYYVIRVDQNIIQLAGTYAEAIAGTEINLTSGSSGTDHSLTLTTDQAVAAATLGTGGEIVGYIINDPGYGYTNCNIDIIDTSGDGSGAVLVANFNKGNVDTLQANVELLAVPGSIEAIKIVEGGAGYSSANIKILGDGTGAEASAVVEGGRVVKINIDNPGSGYTWTDLSVIGNEGASGASIRAIMSPLGGHGSNALDELNSTSLVFYSSISRDKNQGLEITNDYRKVGLVRNLKKFGLNKRFTDDIGSGCVLVTGVYDPTKIQYDMLLFKVEISGSNYKKYRVVEFTDVDENGVGQILLSVFNNFSIVPGDQLVTDPTNGGTQTATVPVSIIKADAVSERTIDQFSGDFLFFSVREPYAPSSDQIITVRTVVTI